MAVKNRISEGTAKALGRIINDVLTNSEKCEWTKPWFAPMQTMANIATPTKPYKGINAFILSMEKSVHPTWKTNFFMTLRKVQEMGMRMRFIGMSDRGFLVSFKDADGVEHEVFTIPVSYWEKRFVSKDGETYLSEKDWLVLDEEEQQNYKAFWMRKWYDVVSCDDTPMAHPMGSEYPDDLKEQLQKVYNKLVERTVNEAPAPTLEDVSDPALDALISIDEAWRCPIYHDETSAYYRPSEDAIHLPKREWFVSTSAYYGTALHEMAHSTQRVKHLARKCAENYSIDLEARAQEELIAEFVAAFTLADRGLAKTIDKEHIAYVQSWRSAIKDPKKVQEIVDIILRVLSYEVKAIDNVEKMLAGEVVDTEAPIADAA